MYIIIKETKVFLRGEQQFSLRVVYYHTRYLVWYHTTSLVPYQVSSSY